MAAPKQFRSAFHGFNREDVVAYIEFLTNQYNSKIAQLNTQLQNAKSTGSDPELQAQLDAANARIAELEAQLAAKGQAADCSQQELEAYRRAEKAERQANERARHVYEKTNEVLAEATAQAESASAHIGAIADQVTEQLKEYQNSIQSTKETFQQAVATLYELRPEEE